MFEQTFITNTGQRGHWTYALGLAGELFVISVLLLLPMIYTDKLTNFGLSHLPIVSPRVHSPKPPELKTSLVKATNARRYEPIPAIYYPSVIPPGPVMPIDIDAPSDAFVPSGPSVNNTFTSLPVGNALAPPPQPQPRPVERQPVQVPTKLKPEPLRVVSEVQAAKIIRRVIPIYPQLARSARVQGTVQLVGMIAKDGTIVRLQVISGHPLLVAAAVDAVRQWVYRPTLLNGEPVEVVAPIDVHFTLGQ